MTNDVVDCAIKNGNKKALLLHPTFMKGYCNRGKVLTKLIKYRQAVTPQHHIVQNALDYGEKNALAFHKNFFPGDKNRNRKLANLIKLFKLGKFFPNDNLFVTISTDSELKYESKKVTILQDSINDEKINLHEVRPSELLNSYDQQTLRVHSHSKEFVAQVSKSSCNVHQIDQNVENGNDGFLDQNVDNGNNGFFDQVDNGNDGFFDQNDDNGNDGFFDQNDDNGNDGFFDQNDDNGNDNFYYPVHRFTSNKQNSDEKILKKITKSYVGGNLFENYRNLHVNLDDRTSGWSSLYWKDSNTTRYWSIQHIHECLPWKDFETKYVRSIMILNQTISKGDYGIRVAVHAHHFAGCGLFAAVPFSDCVDGTPSERVNGLPNWNLQKVRILPLFKSLVEVCGFNPAMIMTGRSTLSLFHAFISSLYSITRKMCKDADIVLKNCVKWLLKEGNAQKRLNVQINGCNSCDVNLSHSILDVWAEDAMSHDMKVMCRDYATKISLFRNYFAKFDHYNESTYQLYFPKTDKCFIKALSELFSVSIVVFDYVLKDTFTYTFSKGLNSHIFLYKVSVAEYFGVFDIDNFVSLR
jgi:hypothetical protein